MKQCPICGSKFAGTESFCPHDGAHLVEAEQPAQLVGKTLHGLFKLESLLYKDAFGERYVGRLVSDGTSVKVTVFNQAFEPQSTRLTSLVTSKTLLDEPMPAEIATVHIWDIEASPPYLIESLPMGPSLRVLLDERGKLDWRTAVKITCALARCLEWMDNLGVTHRMLQPEVISVTQIKRGEAHLGEWALGALSFRDNPLEAVEKGQLVAAAAYMAPELIDGSGKADRRSQIYSLGILLYEMLTGKSPFKSHKTEETLKRQRRERPVKLSISYEGDPLPEALDDLFEVMTAKLPEQRFQALGALVNALSSTLDDDTEASDYPELTRDEEVRPIVLATQGSQEVEEERLKAQEEEPEEDADGKERKHTLLFISAEEVKQARADAEAQVKAEQDDAPDVEDAQKSTIQMDSSVLADDIARAQDRTRSGESSTSDDQVSSEPVKKKKKKKKKKKDTLRLTTGDLPETSNLVSIKDPEDEEEESPHDKKSTIVISKDFAHAATSSPGDDSIIIDDALGESKATPSKSISGSSVTDPKQETFRQEASADSISIQDALDAGRDGSDSKKKKEESKKNKSVKKEEHSKELAKAAAPVAAEITAAPQSPPIDDHWFSTDSEKTWDNEIFMEHELRTDKKFKTYLILAIVLFILSMIVGAVLIATAPEPEEEASLTQPSTRSYMASRTP